LISALLTLVFVALSASVTMTLKLTENRTDLLAYVDRTISAADRRMRQSALWGQMEIDRAAPKTLFDDGHVCEDTTDKHYLISKFGGCA